MDCPASSSLVPDPNSYQASYRVKKIDYFLTTSDPSYSPDPSPSSDLTRLLSCRQNSPLDTLDLLRTRNNHGGGAALPQLILWKNRTFQLELR